MSSDRRDDGMARRGRFFSGFLVLFVGLVLLRALPLIRAYVAKLLSRHSFAALAAAGLAGAAGFALLVLVIRYRPRAALALLGAVALLLIVLSGNLAAAVGAAALLALTFLAGDAVSRLLRGREAGEGDLSGVFAAGVVTMGLVPLLLGEARLLRPASIVVLAAALIAARWRRIPELARLLFASIRMPRGSGPPLLEATWLAAVVLLFGAEWVFSLGPDLSWDGLAYHLPEALETARRGRVDYLPDLAPQTFFWRSHETFLSLGFLFDGERVVRALHFAVAFALLPAVLSLARRLGAGGSGPLVLLALAAFPTADIQLHATYVDWPAGLLLAAAAAEIAAGKNEEGRLRLAGLLVGGAVTTKVFATLGVPALAFVALRRGGWNWRRVAGATVFALLAVLPWAYWSRSRGGSFLAPYIERVSMAAAGLPEQANSAEWPEQPPVQHVASLAGFVRLPYDLTFHSSLFEKNGDGYDGVLALAMLPGILGWGVTGLLLFLVSALAVLVPWFRLYDPTVRYLIPLYPLYALFAAEGLRRLTRDFSGRLGAIAGGALAIAGLAFPVQFGSSGYEWKIATGARSWEQSLTERLPEQVLWRHLGPEDRVVFLGEHDRFHCPAGIAYRAEWYPVNRWGNGPARWRQELSRHGITHLLVRDEAWDRMPLVAALKDRLVLIERSGPAALYLVEPPAGGRP